MLKSLLCLVIGSACLHTAPASAGGDFSDYEELGFVIRQMEDNKLYAPGELESLYEDVSRQQRVLDAISRPAEKRKEWKEYRPNFLTRDRIRKGVAFWQDYAAELERAYRTYGVEPEYIVAILGVETRYGSNKGRFRVLDALSTLAFDYPPRAPFFRKELVEFLILAKAEGKDPREFSGSYAGAMGYPQFMPSSWRNYAVDFDGDGHIDLIDNPVDAIGSIANYFKVHGWKSSQPVARAAHVTGEDYESAISTDLRISSTVGAIGQQGLTLEGDTLPAALPASAIRLQGDNGAEFWLTFDNFYVISRYNRSILYSMAVHQLAQEIRTAWQASRG